jgi:hypothetical protein
MAFSFMAGINSLAQSEVTFRAGSVPPGVSGSGCCHVDRNPNDILPGHPNLKGEKNQARYSENEQHLVHHRDY